MNAGIVPAAADTTPPSAPTGLDRDRDRARPGRPELDRVHRQRRRHRLPGRALPGRGLHQLRPGRDTHRHLFNDTGLAASHLPLPGAGGRRRRQPQPLLLDRHRDDAGRRRHDGAVGAHRALTRPRSAPTQIDLSWTASTDNVGVTGYRVERCQGASCTNFAQVATPTATSFSDTGLAPSTTYRYQVRAVDAAGNLSGYSSIATATTPAAADTTAPSAPTGLSATARQHDPDRPELDRVHRQRRRHRLPGRALPGHELHQLRPGRDPDRHRVQQHRTGRRTPTTASGCGRSTPPGNLSAYSAIVTSTNARPGHHAADSADGAHARRLRRARPGST